MAMKIEGKTRTCTRTFHCCIVTVNENPLKIASSCIREKLWATHAVSMILRCLRKRMNNCHHTPRAVFRSSSTLYSDVRSYLFVIASHLSIITLWVHRQTEIHSATQSRPPCTPSRLACQTSSVLCGIEILDEIAPSSCKCTHWVQVCRELHTYLHSRHLRFVNPL